MIAPWNTLVLAPICSSIPFISSSNVRLSAVSEPLIGSSSSTLPAPKPVTWPCVETAYISPPAAVRQRLLEAFSFSSLDCGNSSLYRLSCMIDLTVSELSATSTSEYDRCKNLHLGFRAKHQLINDLITNSVLCDTRPSAIKLWSFSTSRCTSSCSSCGSLETTSSK